MKIQFELNKNSLLESYDGYSGSTEKSFTDYDYVFGPDGTRYDTKYINSVVSVAKDKLSTITHGTINRYLGAMTIVYTFQVPTMATNTRLILINPGFVLELIEMCNGSIIGVSFVLLHEVYHNLFLHHIRENDAPEHFTDHKLANKAQDYEINWAIEHCYENPKTHNQMLEGITQQCKGLINPDFANMTWEEIYDELLKNPPQEEKEPETSTTITFSDDYKDGYREGWAKAVAELRAQGLIESVSNSKFMLQFFMNINESNTVAHQGTYDDGFDDGYSAAMQAIQSILQGSGGGPGGNGPIGPGPMGPDMPKIKLEKIDGLETIKPVKQDPISGGGDPSPLENPNTPLDVKTNPSGDNNSGSNGTDSQDGQGTDGSTQTQGGQDDQDTNSGSQGGQNKQSTEVEDGSQNTVKVGTADGVFTGKGSGANDGEDNMSEEQVDEIARKAGYKEPIDDPNYAGHNDPFEDTDRIVGDLESMAGQQPGSGLFKIANKIKNVLTPLVDWRSELKSAMKGFFNKLEDAGWNKKKLIRGDYKHMRLKEGETAKRLIFFVDTSGSVVGSGKYLEQITAEIAEIAHSVGARHFDLCQHSDGVYKCTTFTYHDFPEPDEFTIDVTGSGGTSYIPCFKYVEENYVEEGKGFNCVLFFTDMDLSASSIPDEDEFNWSNKIIWFVLNDGKDRTSIDLPYGKVIEVAQKEFNKSIGMNYNKIQNESIKIPKRSKNRVYEGWEDLADEDTAEMANLEANAEKDENGKLIFQVDLSPEAVRKNMIDSLLAAGKLEEYKNNIKKWLQTREQNNELSYGSSYNLTIDDDLYININSDLRLSGRFLTDVKQQNDMFGHFIYENSKKKYISDWPTFIEFNEVKGDLLISDSTLEELPAGLPNIVGGNYILSRLKNLKTLNNSPEQVAKNIIITQCRSLENLVGGPIEFNGSFLMDDDRFSNEDYYAMMANNESLLCGKFDKLIESRIALGNKFKNRNINEAFAKRVLSDPTNPNSAKVIPTTQLSRIFGKRVPTKVYATDPNTGERLRDKNGELMFKYVRKTDASGQSKIKYDYINQDALNALGDMNILWDEIPDEIVKNVKQFDDHGRRVTKNNADNQSAARRNVNGDYTEYGINLYCDKDDKIYIISTGNNKNKYTYVDSRGNRKEETWGAGNSWLWFAPGFFDIVNERISLIRTANDDPSYRVNQGLGACTLTQEEAIEQCNRLGVPYSRNNVYKLGYVKNNADFSENHMFAIPEYCCNSYIIKGTGDDTGSSEEAKNFSYLNHRRAKEGRQLGRLDAISGTYMTGANLNDNDPAVQKYIDKFVTDENILSGNLSRLTFAQCIGKIKDIKNSVISMADQIRTRIQIIANNDDVSNDAKDGLYRRFVTTRYREFIKSINNALNVYEEYFNKVKTDANGINPKVLDKINKTMAYAIVRNNNDTDRVDDLYIDANWYRSYSGTLASMAEILAVTDLLRKGKVDEFNAITSEWANPN